MTNLNQSILDFGIEKNFKDDDFYVSKSNKFAFDLICSWPKWEKNFLNLIGEKYCGKSHLINIFLKKFKGLKIDSKSITNDSIKKIKLYENIVIENFENQVDEKLIYSIINLIDQDNKYLIITSKKPLVNFNFNLNDLNSRSKNFILINIEKPDDDMIFALILKHLSDRQISIDKKLINYIIKRIERSYGKIFEFIYKVDEISLKRKKAIDFKIIKEALGE